MHAKNSHSNLNTNPRANTPFFFSWSFSRLLTTFFGNWIRWFLWEAWGGSFHSDWQQLGSGVPVQTNPPITWSCERRAKTTRHAGKDQFCHSSESLSLEQTWSPQPSKVLVVLPLISVRPSHCSESLRFNAFPSSVTVMSHVTQVVFLSLLPWLLFKTSLKRN